VHSTVRRDVLAGPPARGLGQTSWRVLEGQPESDAWTVLLGPGLTFLAVPLGSGRTYCYADAPSTEEGRGPDRLRELFAGFGGPVPELLAGLGPATAVHMAPIEEVAAPRWTTAGWALVGGCGERRACAAAMGV